MKRLSTEDVLERIMSGNPISIIRCGDGEKIVLDGFTNVKAYSTVLKRQLGFFPPIDHGEQIRENLIEAYLNCDIIGIPMQKNLEDLNNNWQNAENTLYKVVAAAESKEKCSININYDMLEAGYFDEILNNRHTVNYIGCRNLEAQLKARYNLSQVNSFHIAPEAKFTSGYNGPVHYPDQFNKVRRWMEKCRVDGSICMVGAGFIGKLYCNWFKERGGIAMDIGAVMDLWAGKATRGEGRGMDKEDDKYKL